MKKQKLDLEQFEIYADKALSIHNLTYKKMLEKCDGSGKLKVVIEKKEKSIYWWDWFSFTEPQYKAWKEYVIGDLKRKNPQLLEDSINALFDTIDMVYGLNQPYLLIQFVQEPLPPLLEECNPEYRNLQDSPEY